MGMLEVALAPDRMGCGMKTVSFSHSNQLDEESRLSSSNLDEVCHVTAVRMRTAMSHSSQDEDCHVSQQSG